MGGCQAGFGVPPGEPLITAQVLPVPSHKFGLMHRPYHDPELDPDVPPMSFARSGALPCGFCWVADMRGTGLGQKNQREEAMAAWDHFEEAIQSVGSKMDQGGHRNTQLQEATITLLAETSVKLESADLTASFSGCWVLQQLGGAGPVAMVTMVFQWGQSSLLVLSPQGETTVEYLAGPTDRFLGEHHRGWSSSVRTIGVDDVLIGLDACTVDAMQMRYCGGPAESANALTKIYDTLVREDHSLEAQELVELGHGQDLDLSRLLTWTYNYSQKALTVVGQDDRLDAAAFAVQVVGPEFEPKYSIPLYNPSE
eukprot:TRINITY_DN28337_c0_g1_i1.p1 TRINITY_DN28337_c0_g1~~TRINITY_DN28337_c0_g1_i1.p1  ORF type:complete len:311 (+),score=64.37 TRINITY_DN28337_c0_g1_i1:185-1117(+)